MRMESWDLFRNLWWNHGDIMETITEFDDKNNTHDGTYHRDHDDGIMTENHGMESWQQQHIEQEHQERGYIYTEASHT